MFVELTQADESPSIVFVSGQGAAVSAVPGPALCPAASDTADAGDAAASTTTDSGTRDGGRLGVDSDAGTTSPQTVVIPYAALLVDSARPGVRETGVTLSIPQGDGDVIVVATAYGHSGEATACSAESVKLIAVSSVRISRVTGSTA